MSRNKKKRQQEARQKAAGRQQAPTEQPPPASGSEAGANPKPEAPAQPPTSSPMPSRPPQKPIGSLVPWLALIVAMAAAAGTIYNSMNTGRNYARNAGQVRAQLEVVDFLPGPKDIPASLQKVSPITRLNEITLNEVEDFLRLNPRVVVKNIGDEPIDGIRLETRTVFGFIDMVGEPEVRQRAPTPWVLEEAAREEYLLTEKLKPGKTAEVRMIKGLLSQMMQLQARDREDRFHYARFQVRCLGKLVGASAYDGLDDQKVLTIRIVWLPKGFSESVREVLETLEKRLESRLLAQALRRKMQDAA